MDIIPSNLKKIKNVLHKYLIDDLANIIVSFKSKCDYGCSHIYDTLDKEISSQINQIYYSSCIKCRNMVHVYYNKYNNNPWVLLQTNCWICGVHHYESLRKTDNYGFNIYDFNLFMKNFNNVHK